MPWGRGRRNAPPKATETKVVEGTPVEEADATFDVTDDLTVSTVPTLSIHNSLLESKTGFASPGMQSNETSITENNSSVNITKLQRGSNENSAKYDSIPSTPSPVRKRDPNPPSAADKRTLRLAAQKLVEVERAERAAAKKEAREEKREERKQKKAEQKQLRIEKIEKQKAEKEKSAGMRETFAESLKNRATSRIADEIILKWDAYAEKQRLYMVEDPNIPWALRPGIRKVWDLMAPHFRDEVTSTLEVELGLRKKRRTSVDHITVNKFKKRDRDSIIKVHHKRCRKFGDRIRNACLYALYPYNKTIWGAMKEPLWWAILFIRAFPAFGINSLSFGALLMMIDRRDQYQLVQFIMTFKKFQFWLNGVCGLLYYSAAYSYCVVITHPKYTEQCGEGGPGDYSFGGINPNYIVFPVIFGFMLQIVLVWIALYLLNFSLSKGENVRRGARLVGDFVHWEKAVRLKSMNEVSASSLVSEDSSKFKIVEHIGKVVAFDRRTGLHTVDVTHDPLAPKSSKEIILPSDLENVKKTKLQQVPLHNLRYFVVSDRGPLRHLLFYDLGCFFFVGMMATIFLIIAYSQGTLTSGWQLRAVLLGAQIGYSLCAFPFFFASLPPWKYVFTHARETGYNDVGVCVPMLKPFEFPWVVSGAAAGRRKGSVRKDRDLQLSDIKDNSRTNSLKERDSPGNNDRGSMFRTANRSPIPTRQPIKEMWSLAPARNNFDLSATSSANPSPIPGRPKVPKYMPSLDVIPGGEGLSQPESRVESRAVSPTGHQRNRSIFRRGRSPPPTLPGKPLGSELI